MNGMEGLTDQINGMVGSSFLIAGIITVGSIILVGVILFVVLRPILAGAKQRRELLTTGVPAQARILQVNQTGTYINNNPVADLVLEVHPRDRQPFHARTRMTVSMFQIAQVQVGAIVPVRFDPNDLSKVAVYLQ